MLFATASQWVARLAEAHHGGRLQQELVRLGRYPLLVVDEVGYNPFEPEAANLFFQLVSLLARVGIARATRKGTSMKDAGWQEASAAIARRHESSNGEFRGQPDQ